MEVIGTCINCLPALRVIAGSRAAWRFASPDILRSGVVERPPSGGLFASETNAEGGKLALCRADNRRRNFECRHPRRCT
jgi:hypothetical protein